VRVVFLGNAQWSVASLQSLANSSHGLALVVTRAPRPGGRGNRPIPTPVAEAALRAGLPLEEVESVKSGAGFDAIAQAEPDVLAVVAYGEILPAAVLGLPSVAPVNVHFSLLPVLRGAAPVQRAILSGLDSTGVTTIRMDEGMDTGPILLQAEEPIRPEDDAGSLGDRLAVVGGRLLVETLDGLASGSMRERAQDDGAATYAPKIKPDDRVIDWARPAEEIVRLVRAMAPEPGATTKFRGMGLKVLRASVGELPNDVPYADEFPPGSVVDAIGRGPAEGLHVRTLDGAVVLREVALEGRKRMGGGDLIRGYRPLVSETLGGQPPWSGPARG
jgi:methionyl-tRNA formyltransferase